MLGGWYFVNKLLQLPYTVRKTCSARRRYLLSPASGHLLSYSVRLLIFVNFVMEIRSEKSVV